MLQTRCQSQEKFPSESAALLAAKFPKIIGIRAPSVVNMIGSGLGAAVVTMAFDFCALLIVDRTIDRSHGFDACQGELHHMLSVSFGIFQIHDKATRFSV